MNYKRIYSEIILNRVNNPLPDDVYGQKHHILPRSLYPQYEKTKTNIVKLTYREHYICHWLLTKIMPCKQMIHAFWMMNITRKGMYKNSRAYQILKLEMKKYKNGFYGHKHTEQTKRKISEKSSQYIMPQDVKKKISIANKGRKHTEETKKKISKKCIGRKISSQSRKKISMALKGVYVGTKHSKTRKVICLETNIMYDTIKEATEITGINNICACCRGKYKQAGGFHWKYVDEVKNEEE